MENINLNDTKSKGTHCFLLYILAEIQLYTLILLELNIFFKKIKKIRDKFITHNVFRIQDNDSIIYGFYCIAFIEYMLAEKTLSDYTNLFSPNYKENYDKSQVWTKKNK